MWEAQRGVEEVQWSSVFKGNQFIEMIRSVQDSVFGESNLVSYDEYQLRSA